jgi:hypothetical protein
VTLADHLPILPVAIPALAAPFALLVMRRRRALGINISLVSCLAMLASAIALMTQVSDGTILAYELGNWPAPFGIVLVADRLAAMMLVLAATLALIALLHAVVTRADRKGWHFHPLFQFQMMGLNGAFLTGDLFNLFVFFEVLLIASYGLMLHGQGPARLKAGLQYVVVNLVGSSLFLIALGLLYALTGTLNMADMGLRVAALAPEDQGLLRIAALLLVSVFALKAAVAPLHLWLVRRINPRSGGAVCDYDQGRCLFADPGCAAGVWRWRGRCGLGSGTLSTSGGDGKRRYRVCRRVRGPQPVRTGCLSGDRINRHVVDRGGGLADGNIGSGALLSRPFDNRGGGAVSGGRRGGETARRVC